ncbi:MAG: hypothetical protein RIC95_12035 [Vicingaceae bacterium]
MSDSEFKTKLETARQHQKALNQIYKATVGLVNDLKNRSKKYMVQVADIDQGFSNSPEKDQEQIEKNVNQLTDNIKVFNAEIGERGNHFSTELSDYIEYIDQALALYKGEKGELSDLLRIRRELLFLEALLRKFKSKISSLQLMNNALFAFSQEMRGVKEAYRSNLINVSTLITQAMEDCQERIERIEDIE